MLFVIRHAAAACAAVLPLALSAQNPRTLGKPDAEFAEPFTQITTLRELRDGRVLVVDQRERSLQLIDFKSGAATRVGRLGSGPAEYGFPGRIIALPGDTSALHDGPNARYLLIKPDGTPGEIFRLDQPVASSLGGRGSVPRGADARGRIFFEGAPFVNTPDRGLIPADSAPVMRYDRATTKLDTVAWIHLGKGTATVTPGPGRGISISVGAQPFPVRDNWGPMPDGGIAIARVSDYHVERYTAAGVRTVGAPVRMSPIAVGEAEKEAWRVERKRLAGQPRSGGGAGANAPLMGLNPEFPAFMPPFVWSSAFARPNGEFWVLRSRKASDPPTYDVFNATAALVMRVSVAKAQRLVGFGNGTVYVVRRDDDDLEYLQRYTFR